MTIAMTIVPVIDARP
jgi:hypothetical protein